ncbi:MAG: cytochrome c [Anaerolineae bacterium]|nr:cytochrome c [Anaerolineae bacterium]
MNKKSIRLSQRRRKQKLAKIKSTVFMIAGSALIILALNLDGLTDPARGYSQAELREIGQAVFQANCQVCHGEQGEGHQQVEQAPALNGSEHAWHHPDRQLSELISDGGEIMPPFGKVLTDTEIIAVIRYFQGWWAPDQLAMQQSR